MKKLIAMMLAISLTMVMGFAGGKKDNYVIKLAYTPTVTDPNASPDVMYGSVFKEYVERESKGRIVVDIYPGDQLGSANEVVRSVASNAVEMAIVNMTILNNLHAPTMLLSVPGLFASVEECNAILNGDWGKNFFEEVRTGAKIKILNTGSNGFRNFTNNIREVHNMSDARGITFRVMDSPVSIRMVESMGARAVPMPGSEMYMAMRQGVVDGQENPILNIIQDRTFEVQKYLTLDGHMASIMTYIISDNFYSSLPSDLKKIIDEGSKLACDKANEVITILNNNGVDFLRQQGMVVTIPTEAALREWHDVIFNASQEYVRSQIDGKYVDSLMSALNAYRK